MAVMNCGIKTARKYNVRLNKNKAAFQMYVVDIEHTGNFCRQVGLSFPSNAFYNAFLNFFSILPDHSATYYLNPFYF